MSSETARLALRRHITADFGTNFTVFIKLLHRDMENYQ